MERSREHAFRRSAVLLVVLGGHVLLLSLICASRHSYSGKLEPEEAQVLLLAGPEQRAEPPTATRGPARKNHPRAAPSANFGQVGESNALTLTAPSSKGPKADWQVEAKIAAGSVMPQIEREDRRRCAEAEWKHAARPLGCKKRYYDKPWQASGNLLEDMRDPERPRGGTPDPLADAFLSAPLPVVLEDQDPHH